MLHGCETGDAKITKGYKLPARHVVHAVGPVWHGGGQGEDEALASCYRRAIELGQARGLASIAFPAISTGVYRFPAERAAGIAVSATVGALSAAPAVTNIVFCCFSAESARLHGEVLAGFGSPCTD
jgi:O-acetyl-ADP-ribose deacetylase (regulator of RNase III)